MTRNLCIQQAQNRTMKEYNTSRQRNKSIPQNSFWKIVLLSLIYAGCTDGFQNPNADRTFNSKLTKLWSSRVTTAQSRTWDVHRVNTDSLDNTSRSRQKMKPMPVTGYDAQAIEEFYDRRPLQVGWRLNSIGFPLLGTFVACIAPFDCFIKTKFPKSVTCRMVPRASF